MYRSQPDSRSTEWTEWNRRADNPLSEQHRTLLDIPIQQRHANDIYDYQMPWSQTELQDQSAARHHRPSILQNPIQQHHTNDKPIDDYGMGWSQTESQGQPAAQYYRPSHLESPIQQHHASDVGEYQAAWSETETRGQPAVQRYRPSLLQSPIQQRHTNVVEDYGMGWSETREQPAAQHHKPSLLQSPIQQRHTNMAEDYGMGWSETREQPAAQHHKPSLLQSPIQQRRANDGEYQMAWSETEARGQPAVQHYATQLSDRSASRLQYRSESVVPPTNPYRTDSQSWPSRPEDHYGTYTERRSVDHHGSNIECHSVETRDNDEKLRYSYFERDTFLPQTSDDGRREERRGLETDDRLRKRRHVEVAYTEEEYGRQGGDPQMKRRYTEQESSLIEKNGPKIVSRLMQLAGCPIEQERKLRESRENDQQRMEANSRRVKAEIQWTAPRPLEIEERRLAQVAAEQTQRQQLESDRQGPEIVSRLMKLAGLPTEQRHQPFEGRETNRHQFEPDQHDRDIYYHQTKPRSLINEGRPSDQQGPEIVSRLMQLAGIPMEQLERRQNDNHYLEPERLRTQLDSPRAPRPLLDERCHFGPQQTDQQGPEIISRLMKLAGLPAEEFERCLNNKHRLEPERLRTQSDSHQAPRPLLDESRMSDRNRLQFDNQQTDRQGPAIVSRLMQLAGLPAERCEGRRTNQQPVKVDGRSSGRHLPDRGSQWPDQPRREFKGHQGNARPLKPVSGLLGHHPQEFVAQKTNHLLDQERLRERDNQWTNPNPLGQRQYHSEHERNAANLLLGDAQSQMLIQNAQRELINLTTAAIQGQLLNMGMYGQGQSSGLNTVDIQSVLLNLNQGGVLDQLMNVNLQDVLGNLNNANIQGQQMVRRHDGGNQSGFRTRPEWPRKNLHSTAAKSQPTASRRAPLLPVVPAVTQLTTGVTGSKPRQRVKRHLNQQGPIVPLGQGQPVPPKNEDYKSLRKEQERKLMPKKLENGYESLSDTDSDDVVEPAERLPGTITQLHPTTTPSTKKPSVTDGNALGGVVSFVMKTGTEITGRFISERSVANGYRLKTLRKYSGNPGLNFPFKEGTAVNVIDVRKYRDRRDRAKKSKALVFKVDIEFSDGNVAGAPFTLEDLSGKEIPNLDGSEVLGSITHVHKEIGIASFTVGENTPSYLAHFTVQDIVLGGVQVPKSMYRHVLYVGMSVPLKITSSSWTRIPGIYYTADSSMNISLSPGTGEPTKLAPLVNGIIVKASDDGPSLISCCSMSKCGERFYVVCNQSKVNGGSTSESDLHFGEGTRVACKLHFKHDYGKGASSCVYLATVEFPLRKVKVLTLQTFDGMMFPHELLILSKRLKKRVALERRYIKVNGEKPASTFPRKFFNVDSIIELNDCLIRCKRGPAVSLDISNNALTRKGDANIDPKVPPLCSSIFVVKQCEGTITAIREDSHGMVLPKTVSTVINGIETEVDLFPVIINLKRDLFVHPSLFKIGQSLKLYQITLDEDTKRYSTCLKRCFSKELLTNGIVENDDSAVTTDKLSKRKRRSLAKLKLLPSDQTIENEPLVNTSPKLTEQSSEQVDLLHAGLQSTDQSSEQEDANAGLQSTDQSIGQEELTHASPQSNNHLSQQDDLILASPLTNDLSSEQEDLILASPKPIDQSSKLEDLTHATPQKTDQPNRPEDLAHTSPQPIDQSSEKEDLANESSNPVLD